MKRAAAFMAALLLVSATLASCSKPLAKMSASDLLDLGDKYLLDMDYEQAAVYFDRLIEIEPRNQRGYTGLAEAYLAQDEVDDAIDVLRDGLDELPDDRRFLRQLTDIYEEIIEISPSTRDAYIGLADVYIARGDVDMAVNILIQGYTATGSNGIAEKLRELSPEWEPPQSSAPLPSPDTSAPTSAPTHTPAPTPTPAQPSVPDSPSAQSPVPPSPSAPSTLSKPENGTYKSEDGLQTWTFTGSDEIALSLMGLISMDGTYEVSGNRLVITTAGALASTSGYTITEITSTSFFIDGTKFIRE